MTLDLAIRRGTVLTERGEITADVGVSGDKIAAVGTVRHAAKEIDARGKLVMPGVVDMHAHLSTRGLDDIAAGTRAAAAGGVTTVVSFARQTSGESLLAAAERAVAEATGASVDFAFHVTVTDPSARAAAELPDLVAAGHGGLKIFMVERTFPERALGYLRLLRAAGRAGALTLVHAEDYALVALSTRELLDAGRTGLASYAESRPVEAEEIAVRVAIGYAVAAEAPVYLVHLSSRRAVHALREGRSRRAPVHGETRPLYLYLTRKAYERPDGAIFVGQPPLRDQADVDAIWTALADGTLATVGTDHYPHKRADKLDPLHTFATIPPGVANLQTLLPMLYSEGVRKGRLTLRRLVEVLCSEPARLAGLAPRKGIIAVGADADLVVFDPDLKRTVRSSDLRSNADHDVFDGWEVTGWPVTVLCRGRVVYELGERIDAAGHGRHVPRGPTPRA